MQLGSGCQLEMVPTLLGVISSSVNDGPFSGISLVRCWDNNGTFCHFALPSLTGVVGYHMWGLYRFVPASLIPLGSILE
jgi:hypothetical protein